MARKSKSIDKSQKHFIDTSQESNEEIDYDLIFKKYKEKIDYVDREVKDYEDVKDKLICQY